jgi:hypothetical protein
MSFLKGDILEIVVQVLVKETLPEGAETCQNSGTVFIFLKLKCASFGLLE